MFLFLFDLKKSIHYRLEIWIEYILLSEHKTTNEELQTPSAKFNALFKPTYKISDNSSHLNIQFIKK